MRIAAFALALACLLVGAMGYVDHATLGFPDGHLTEFERETKGARAALFAINLAVGAAILLMLFRRRRIGAAAWPLMAFVLLIAAFGALLPSCPSLSFCSSGYQAVMGHPPNHGQGG